MTQNILQTLLGLAAVIGMFLVMAWLVRRFSQGPGFGGKHLQLLAGISLGAKEKLLIVDAGGQQLLLGVTGQQIRTLHTFAEPVIKQEAKPSASDFAQKLQSILRKSTSPGVDRIHNEAAQTAVSAPERD